jgi:hypothetical protein
MTPERAQEMVKEITKGRKRWGKMFSSPYSVDSLYDALVTLDEADRKDEAASSEEIASLRQQLNLCRAREAKVNKRAKTEDNTNTGE